MLYPLTVALLASLDFEQQKDFCSLMNLVARYDRSLARDLAQPLLPLFRRAMAQRVHSQTIISDLMLGAFSTADPQWTVELVRTLPDVAGKPFDSPRQTAGLCLADHLVRPPVGPA